MEGVADEAGAVGVYEERSFCQIEFNANLRHVKDAFGCRNVPPCLNASILPRVF